MSDRDAAPPPKSAGIVHPQETQVVSQFKHERSLLSCRYDPSGRYIVAGSQDNSVVRWNAETGEKTVLAGHGSWTRGLAFSPDGTTLLTSGYDGRLVWWRHEDGASQPLRTVEAHDGWIRAVDVSPDGQLIATVGNDHLVKLFRMDSGELVAELAGHEDHVYSVLFHPDGESLLSGDLLCHVRQWNVESQEMMRTFDAKPLRVYHESQRVHYGGVRCLALSGDGTQLACGGLHEASNPLAADQQPLVVVFDWESGEQMHTLEAGEKVIAITWRVIYHPEGFLISVSGSEGGYLMFFKPGENTAFHRLKVAGSAFDGDLHPDGLHIATAHHDGQIRVSRMTTT